MNKQEIKSVIWIGMLLLSAVLWSVCFWSGQSLQRQNQRLSLRYDTESVLAEQIKYREGDEEKPAYLLWNAKTNKTIATETTSNSANVTMVTYFGQLRLIGEGMLISGVFSDSEAEKGCVLDEETAFRLWGNLDILGKILLIDGEKYFVQGIVESPRKTIYIQQQKEEFYGAIELAFEDNAKNKEENIQNLFMQKGIPFPDTIIDRFSKGKWLNLAMSLPAWTILGIVVYFGITRLGAGPKLKPVFLLLWLFCVGLLAWGAIGIFDLHLVFPENLTPTRWSDFEFWTKRFEDFQRNFLAAANARTLPGEVAERGKEVLCYSSAMLTSILFLYFARTLPPHWAGGFIGSMITALLFFLVFFLCFLKELPFVPTTAYWLCPPLLMLGQGMKLLLKRNKPFWKEECGHG